MKKKGLPLIVSIVCLGLLCVGYVALKSHNEKVAENEEETVKVFNLESTDIASVQLNIEDKEEVFTLEDDTWKLSSDDSFTVSKTSVDNLVTSVTGLSATRTLTDVTDLESYGLTNPVQTVVLTDTQGNTYTVCWGNTNDITGDDYVYIKEEPDVVYTVDYSVLTGIATTLEDYKEAEETSEEVSE